MFYEKIIVLIVVTVIFTAHGRVGAQTGTSGQAKGEPFLFRSLSWGASKEDMIAKEGSRFTEINSGSDKMYMYRGLTVGGRTAEADFIIAPGLGLKGGFYHFSINTAGFPYNTKPFIDGYASLYGMLCEIYGKPGPGSMEIRSKGTDINDFMEHYYTGGAAAEWRVKGTAIRLDLRPKEAEDLEMADWELSIYYVSPQMLERSKVQNKQGL